MNPFPHHSSASSIRLWRLFLILLVFGFGLRIAYGVARYRGAILHLSGRPFITSWDHDGLEHVLIAKALLSGEGYIVDDFPLPAGKRVHYARQDAVFKAPLYEYFLAAVFAVSGFSFKLFFPLQALFGGLTCGLIGLVAWETFQRWRVAYLAGILAVVHPVLVNAASQPYNEDLYFFLFVAAIWLFFIWFRTRVMHWAILCGVTVGLCTLTRESALPLLAAMGVVGILSAPRDLKAWTTCAAIVLTAIIIVSPWTIRNYLNYHAFIPVASIVGIDLASGNNECVAAENLLTSYWAEDGCPAMKLRIADLSNVLVLPATLPAATRADQIAKHAAVDFIKANPGAYVKLALRRFWTVLLPYVPRGNQHSPQKISFVLYWLAIFPAGIIGLFANLKRPEPHTVFLALMIALSFLSIMAVLYWSDLRFRIGIDLLLGCFAASAYDRLFSKPHPISESPSISPS